MTMSLFMQKIEGFGIQHYLEPKSNSTDIRTQNDPRADLGSGDCSSA